MSVLASIVITVYWTASEKTYLLELTPNEDSNQTAHCAVWLESSLSVWRNLAPLSILNGPMKILIRLRKSAGWSKSSIADVSDRTFVFLLLFFVVVVVVVVVLIFFVMLRLMDKISASCCHHKWCYKNMQPFKYVKNLPLHVVDTLK